MVTEGLLLKVRIRSEPRTIADPDRRSARCAAPSRTDLPPIALNNRIRSWSPPILVRAIMRTVWLFNPAIRGGIPKRRAGTPGAGGATAAGGGTLDAPAGVVVAAAAGGAAA